MSVIQFVSITLVMMLCVKMKIQSVYSACGRLPSADIVQ